MAAIRRLVDGIEAVVAAFGWIAAALCVVLVFLVAGDVVARYLFRVGAVWLQELHWHLISPIALFGMSYALLCGEQVRVDVFFERYPPRAKRAIEVLGGMLLFGIGLWLADRALPWVGMSWQRNEMSPNPGGLPARWLLKSLIPLGFLLLSLQGLAHALRHGFGLPPRGADQ